MKQNRRYNKSYPTHAIVGGFLIVCLSLFYMGRPGFSFDDYSKDNIVSGWTTSSITKLVDFGKDISGRFAIIFFERTSSQLVKTNSSLPLSGLNYTKSRPRGIPAQEPSCKFLSFSSLILIYPPYTSSFIATAPFLILTTLSGSAIKIRPPPNTMLKETGFSA
jgi:hypothetical protein